MASREDWLRSALRAIEDRDPQLAREMRSIRDRSTTLEMAPRPGVEIPGFAQDLTLETIVLRTGRPVLAVSHEEPRLVFDDAESEVWRERLTAARGRLMSAIPAVGRIELKNDPRYDWVGTGWLVSEDTVVTNRHVASEFARSDGKRFIFRGSPMGQITASVDFLREVDNSSTYSFEVSDVLYIEPEGGPDLSFLRLRAKSGSPFASPIMLSINTPSPQHFVAVIGYPARDSRIPEQDLMDRIFGNVYDKKRLAPGQVMSAADEMVQHDCSTLGGNSGSVVLSLTTGEAVALHFSGRFLESNYAVPATLVADRLHKLSRGGASSAARMAHPTLSPRGPAVEQAVRSTYYAKASFEVPLIITVTLGTPRELLLPRPSNVPTTDVPANVEAETDESFLEARAEDYSDREGYLKDFLGSNEQVSLPAIAAHDVVTFDDKGEQTTVLRYEHFSVVMSRSRRMCFFSAANVNGRLSRKMKRSGWKIDPRIPKDLQILKECYGNPPKFSRGHMTRREDPIWGSPANTTRGNQDSMHVTNVVPQMQPFNAPIWLGLEDYALEHAREDDMLISVFTGPFFTKNDPIMYGIKIPVSFWKIIAFIHDDTKELCATGYTMSQSSFLREEEFVFGQHETSQIPVATIEARSGLKFPELSAVDPLRHGEEALALPLTDYSQIKFY